jgi:hypothetical protein
VKVALKRGISTGVLVQTGESYRVKDDPVYRWKLDVVCAGGIDVSKIYKCMVIINGLYTFIAYYGYVLLLRFYALFSTRWKKHVVYTTVGPFLSKASRQQAMGRITDRRIRVICRVPL